MSERFTEHRRVRVLHVLSEGRLTGVHQYELDLCAALPRDRFRVDVCFLLPGPLLPVAESMGLHTAVAVWTKPNDFRAAWRFASYLRVGDFDILHAHQSWRRLRIVARRCGIKHILNHVHHVPSEIELPEHRGGLDSWLRTATTHCDRCIADSEYVRDQLLANRDGAEGKIELVQPGLDSSRWIKRLPTADAKAALQISPDQPVVGIVGRLGQVRRLDLFLEVAAAVHQQRPQTVFIICGEGDLRADLEAKASALGIAKSVRFLGWRRDLVDVMAAFDVYALTTVTDVFARYALEPMVMGIPVVGFAVGSLPSWVEHGETGFLAPLKNIAHMRDSIIHLIDHPDQRAALGENARRRAREQYDIAHPARRMNEIYENLLESV
jgi:glycosyltransferase involved in cell wall biosynthesis